MPEIYVYNDIPKKVRVQIVHILRDAIGGYYAGYDSPNKLGRELINGIPKAV